MPQTGGSPALEIPFNSIAVSPTVIALALMNHGAKNSAEYGGAGRGHDRLPLRSLRPCRNVINRALALANQVGAQREHVIRRTLSARLSLPRQSERI